MNKEVNQSIDEPTDVVSVFHTQKTEMNNKSITWYNSDKEPHPWTLYVEYT